MATSKGFEMPEAGAGWHSRRGLTFVFLGSFGAEDRAAALPPAFAFAAGDDAGQADTVIRL